MILRSQQYITLTDDTWTVELFLRLPPGHCYFKPLLSSSWGFFVSISETAQMQCNDTPLLSPPLSVHNWTMEDAVQWLKESVELPQYERNFRDFRVTGNTLPRSAQLTSDHPATCFLLSALIQKHMTVFISVTLRWQIKRDACWKVTWAECQFLSCNWVIPPVKWQPVLICRWWLMKWVYGR